jgi:hypothetical protein
LLDLHAPFWIRFGRGDKLFSDVLAGNGVVFDLELYGGHLHLKQIVLLIDRDIRNIQMNG